MVKQGDVLVRLDDRKARGTVAELKARADFLKQADELFVRLGAPQVVGLGKEATNTQGFERRQLARDAGVTTQNVESSTSLAARRNRQLDPGQVTALRRRRSNTLLAPTSGNDRPGRIS